LVSRTEWKCCGCKVANKAIGISRLLRSWVRSSDRVAVGWTRDAQNARREPDHRRSCRTPRRVPAYIVSERPPDSASTARRRSLWVSRDTTMRNRRQLRSNPKRRSDVKSLPEANCAAPVARLFSPSELDLDDLAEAIRLLLGTESVPQITSPGRPDPDLLPVSPRVTHVVEATPAP
jgi:hypothetical protein